MYIDYFINRAFVKPGDDVHIVRMNDPERNASAHVN